MSYVYLNGQHLPADTARVPCNDRGFLLGDGIFTTLKSAHSCLQHFPQHYSRLAKSADELDIPLNYDESELAQICVKVIENNELTQQIAALRITLTRGHGGRGLDLPGLVTPSILVTAVPYKSPIVSVSLGKTSIARHSTSLASKHKTLNYLDSIMARERAKQEGHDDALFCNESGLVACTTAANIFFIQQGVVKTPALDCGILPGIMRQCILEVCRDNNIMLEEGHFKLDELLQAEEAFLTNSLIEIMPVRTIGEHSFAVEKNNFAYQLSEYLIVS